MQGTSEVRLDLCAERKCTQWRIPVIASAHLTAAATQLSTSHSKKDGRKVGLPVRACKLCKTQGRASTNSLGTSETVTVPCAAPSEGFCCCLKNAVRLAGRTTFTVKTCTSVTKTLVLLAEMPRTPFACPSNLLGHLSSEHASDYSHIAIHSHRCMTQGSRHLRHTFDAVFATAQRSS